MTKSDIQKRLQDGHRSRLSPDRKQAMRERLVAQMEAEEQIPPIQQTSLKRRKWNITPYAYSAAGVIVAAGIATSITLASGSGHGAAYHEMMSTGSSSASGTTSSSNGNATSSAANAPAHAPTAGPAKSHAGLAKSNTTFSTPEQSIQAASTSTNSRVEMTATSGWFVDSKNHLLQTNDGGQTWRNVTPSGENFAQSTIVADDFSHGQTACFAVQKNGQGLIDWTVDGGVHWTVGSVPLAASSTIEQMVLVNASTGFLIVTDASHPANASQLWRTIDGGSHWTEVNAHLDAANIAVTLFANAKRQAISFQSSLIGYRVATTNAQSNPTVIERTSDSGRTWSDWKPNLKVPPALQGDTLQIDQPPLLVGGQGVWPVYYQDRKGQTMLEVYQTNSSGNMWTATTPVPVNATSTVNFISAHVGWRLDPAQNQFWQTSDGGAHWNSVASGVPIGTLTSISPVSQLKAYALLSHAGEPPMLAVTMNGGQTWVKVRVSIDNMSS